MIYTDGTHLVADDIEELHNFAINILGFKRKWFQDHNPGTAHYDLTTKKAFKRAIDKGVQCITPKELLKKCILMNE